jgi:hypothetical protein
MSATCNHDGALSGRDVLWIYVLDIVAVVVDYEPTFACKFLMLHCWERRMTDHLGKILAREASHLVNMNQLPVYESCLAPGRFRLIAIFVKSTVMFTSVSLLTQKIASKPTVFR